jgi:hypothetical protein
VSNGASASIAVDEQAARKPQTYNEIAIHLLKNAGRPMHISDIVAGIEQFKGLARGSITRPSVQTTLTRFMAKRSGLLRKPKDATFEYIGEGGEN